MSEARIAELPSPAQALAALAPYDFTVRVGPHPVVVPGEGQPNRFTLSFPSPDAAARVLSLRDALSIGNAYVEGEVDVDGDLVALVEVAARLLSLAGVGGRRDLTAAEINGPDAPADRGDNGVAVRLEGDPKSLERARRAVSHHYDLPEEFWRLWLDPTLLYTCAYYASPGDSLEEASTRKMDLVCRKLLLREGDELLDVGCGWGSFSIHAARRYGARVLGITLSERQADVARRRAAEAGVADRCRIEVRDFRELEGAMFDKIAAIGVIEHVGVALQPPFFQRLAGVLRPGGLCLNQGIVRSPQDAYRGGQEFIQRYIFPDASLSTLGFTLSTAEGAGLDIRDVESLSDHYIPTLRAWLGRLEGAADGIRQLTSDAHYRAFRAYLANFVYAFQQGDFRVYQTLLHRRGDGAALPLTRGHLLTG